MSLSEDCKSYGIDSPKPVYSPPDWMPGWPCAWCHNTNKWTDPSYAIERSVYLGQLNSEQLRKAQVKDRGHFENWEGRFWCIGCVINLIATAKLRDQEATENL